MKRAPNSCGRLRAQVRQETHSQVLGADLLKSVTASGAEPRNSHVIAPGSPASLVQQTMHTEEFAPPVQIHNASASQSGLLGTVDNLVPIARRPLDSVASCERRETGDFGSLHHAGECVSSTRGLWSAQQPLTSNHSRNGFGSRAHTHVG